MIARGLLLGVETAGLVFMAVAQYYLWRASRTAVPSARVEFDEAAAGVIARAQALARDAGGARIELTHLLMALLDSPSGTCASFLANASVDARPLIATLEATAPPRVPALAARLPYRRLQGVAAGCDLPFTHAAAKALGRATIQAARLGDTMATPWHILLGILDDSRSVPGSLLAERGVTRREVEALLEAVRVATNGAG